MMGEETAAGLISGGAAAMGCLASDTNPSVLVLAGVSPGCHEFKSPHSTLSKHTSSS